ncbi:MAG: class I SAM-dependent methyltransferase [Steroidobacteraceae bacterium]|nr:class I SAM-dependent methyltransferase [Steroidobacteraceae bacterium]
MRWRFLFPVLVALLGACASQPSLQAPPPSTATPAPPRDAATAAAIETVLASEHRSAENRARDAQRHPLETLLFFGLVPDMTVVEVWPGAGGWYTEILAPLLAEHGKLYTAQLTPAPENPFVTSSLKNFADKLAAHPVLYGKVEVTTLGVGAPIAPAGSADLVLTFRNVHNWMSLGIAKEAFEAMHQALKPGGILGVVEHRGDPAKPQDPRAASGYVNEEFAIDLIQSVGFELVDRSGINSNPEDTKDHPQGVWTLPPNYRLGNRDRAKYEAIGESDRFTLKFRKK